MPNLADMLGGRKEAMTKGGKVNEAGKLPFFFFCDRILECVAGKKEWKQQKAKQTVSSSCVSVTDEAFAMLLMINSWDKFEYMAEHAEIDDKSEVPETLYTEKKGRNRKMQGWSTDGIEKFNKLCLFVIEDRKSEEGQQFENEFKEFNEKKAKEDKLGANEVDGDDELSSDDDAGGEPQPKRSKFAFNHLVDLAGVGLVNV